MTETVKHKITSTDQQVRGYPGTSSTCICGWSSAWSVRDGSAEADANEHMRAKAPGYAERQDTHYAEFLADYAHHRKA